MTVRLGTPVQFRSDKVLKRFSRHVSATAKHGWGLRKFWSQHNLPERLTTVESGLIIGIRTLSNGFGQHVYEEGWNYQPEEYIKVYLVAVDLRRKPIYIRVEDAIFEEEPHE